MEERIIEFKKRGKTKRVLLTKEAIALKRLRILKKITRSRVAAGIGVSVRIIERVENGRTQLDDSRLKMMLRFYKTSHQEFEDILVGKTMVPDLPAHSVHKRIGEGNYVRRFDTKRITKEVRVLKTIREMRRLSQSKTAELCGVHRKSIGHIENGRVEVTEDRLNMLLKAYSFPKEEYLEMVNEDLLRDEVIKECTQILKTIEKDKLKAVRALLINFK